MIQWIRWVSLFLALQMIAGVVLTSMQSNLFEEGGALLEIPWMVATLQDFYTNVGFIAIWVIWREERVWARIVWVLGLVVLGSIATALYIFWISFQLDADRPMTHLMLGRHLHKEG